MWSAFERFKEQFTQKNAVIVYKTFLELQSKTVLQHSSTTEEAEIVFKKEDKKNKKEQCGTIVIFVHSKTSSTFFSY